MPRDRCWNEHDVGSREDVGANEKDAYEGMSRPKHVMSTRCAARWDSGTELAPTSTMVKNAEGINIDQPREPRSDELPQGPSPAGLADRAHHRFLERGSEPGRDADDWLEAERELGSTAPRTRAVRANSASQSTSPAAGERPVHGQ